MAGRFSDIKNAAEYKRALDNYVDYLQNIENRPSKRLQGGTPGETKVRQSVVVRPFGADFGSASGFITTASKDSVERWKDTISQRILIAENQLANAQVRKGFRAARLQIFEPDNSGGTGRQYVQSKITKLYYLKYPGTNYAVPFGATSEAEEQSKGAKDAKNAILKKMQNLDYKRVSVRPEKVPG